MADAVKDNKKKWYMKWWVIIFIWPILLLVWISKLIWRQKWDRKYKIAAIAALWMLAYVGNLLNTQQNDKKIQAIKNQPKWECIGPDGKKIGLTQSACDEFNNAWRNGNKENKTDVSIASPSVQPTKTQQKAQPTKESEHELDATVRFNTTAVLITNNEKENWRDCKFEINPGGLFSSGYTYKQKELIAQDQVIIPFSEFAKGDGTRFNTYETKAKDISIFCEVKGVSGFNYFSL